MHPDSVELAEAAAAWAGAYVHVPFCARICPYCDFNVVAGRDDLQDRYVDAVLAEIDAEQPWRPVEALAFGGGTPSRVPAPSLISIVEGMRRKVGIADGAEVGLEANPEDWSDTLGGSLVAGGFNRVSFGAQSFDPEVLAILGRLHDPRDIVAGVQSARRTGFRSISLDLMFGTPGESPISWRESLECALALEPDHLSLYALTVERGTALSRAVRDGSPPPDEDDQADKYDVAQELLSDAGYVRYEVSNFARPDHACRYNLLTWGQGEYLGFGPGAHGHRSAFRYRNIHRLDAYLAAVGSGRRPEQGRDRFTAWEREQERLMLGLRRAAGAEVGLAGEALMKTEWGRRLVSAGVLRLSAGRLVVEKPLLGDEVARAVLALAPVDC